MKTRELVLCKEGTSLNGLFESQLFSERSQLILDSGDCLAYCPPEKCLPERHKETLLRRIEVIVLKKKREVLLGQSC